MPYALTPAYWSDFDAVSSGLPPPLSSLLPLLLVASAVSGCVFILCLVSVICFCHPRPSCFSMSSLQPVVTLRPFTPCFNCWCLQRQSIITPRFRWWFRGTHPSWCLVEGSGLEPLAHPKHFGDSLLCVSVRQLSPLFQFAGLHRRFLLFPSLPLCLAVFRKEYQAMPSAYPSIPHS